MNFKEQQDIDYYCSLPFAMDTTSGEIISMTGDFQRKLVSQVLKKYDVLEIELVGFISIFGNEYYGNSYIDGYMEYDGVYMEYDTVGKLAVISDMLGDILPKILGFNMEKKEFTFEGMGRGESDAGWAAADWIEELGFNVKEKVYCEPNGHGDYGYRYVDEVDDEDEGLN